MGDLRSLQFPRYLHRGGASRLVPDAATADALMDDGWTLTPADQPRVRIHTGAEAPISPEATPAPSLHAPDPGDTGGEVADPPAKASPKRRKKA